MKILVAFLFGVFYCHIAFAQPGIWTWMKGDTTCTNLPVDEPKCNYACPFWTDTTGNFWVYMNPGLWKYNPITNGWTAMAGCSGYALSIQALEGVFDSLNCPGKHINGAFTWTTPDNSLWMYGGIGESFESSSMLWKYSIALNQWAWMGTFSPPDYGVKGVPSASNKPGYRQESNTAWVDNLGNLWFFSGGNCTNDVWKYDVPTGIWTWMSGSNVDYDPGNYGAIGVPSVDNYPSGRYTNFFWVDDAGNLWVGLGLRFDGPDIISPMDIWKFNPVSLEWTWKTGFAESENSCPIGEICELIESNQAGERFENRSTWKISDQLILTYAGVSCSENTNDLWAFLPIQNSWVKIAEYPVSGHYGAKEIPSPLDSPNWRSGAASFKDKNNNCWVFGGRSFSGDGNDLWKYEVDLSCTGIVGIDKIIENETISVYPNPAFDEINISSGDLQVEQIRIYNSNWQLIREINQPLQMKIDISNFPKGFYFTEIKLKDTLVQKRWLKM